MTQVPLAPPPPTGGPLDGWLYLLWRRLTQAGQILWESITPGTSADVAAAVTDETGSPGSLVFSGNPTLTGLTVSGAAFTSRGITDNATATALTLDSSGRSLFGYGAVTSVAGISPTLQVNATSAAANFSILRNTTPGGSGAFLYLSATRGAAGTYTAVQAGDGLGSIFASGADGTTIVNGAAITFRAEGTISTGIVPATIVFYTYNSSGVLTEAAQFNSAQVCTLGGSSTAPALKVTPVASQARWVEVTGATSSGNPKLNTSAGSLELGSTGSTALTVTSDGYFYHGDTTQPDGLSPANAMFSTNSPTGIPFAIRRSGSVAGAAASMGFIRSRGTNASPTAVSTGDNLGAFNFYGYDGTNYIRSGQVLVQSTGTVSSGVIPGNLYLLTADSAGVLREGVKVGPDQVVTLGGLSTAPALKVTPVASQARWIEVTGATSSTDPTIGTSGGNLACSAVFMPKQATTAGAPAYVLGGMYYDTTLNKLRIGGATAWETVTSV